MSARVAVAQGPWARSLTALAVLRLLAVSTVTGAPHGGRGQAVKRRAATSNAKQPWRSGKNWTSHKLAIAALAQAGRCPPWKCGSATLLAEQWKVLQEMPDASNSSVFRPASTLHVQFLEQLPRDR
eukprot:7380376-Prymnesium_polylepis.1